MDSHPSKAATASLAGRAAELSVKIYTLQGDCDHQATTDDISSIAAELALLSTTLHHLNEAMSADPQQYTESFDEDLAEITGELTLVFDEVSECSVELQKADGGNSAVAWFFKKGRVNRLQKRIETLKTTLIVMRTVLHHGKEYGTHNSPGRLAESSPHTMHEDRVILESVVARSRNAILDLHNLEETRSHHQSSSSGSSHPEAAGTHHRNLSNSTGIEISPIPDVLPSATKSEKEKKTNAPLRRFSKRGVRLGVHMSILDMGAHEAPKGLKDKWIQRSRDGATGTAKHGNFLGGLSKISEVDSMSTIPKEMQQEWTESKNRLDKESTSREDSDKATLDNRTSKTGRSSEGTGSGDSSESSSKRNARYLVNGTMGRGLRKMIQHLTLSTPNVDKGKQREDAEPQPEPKPGSGFRRILSVMVGGNSPLTTPDYEREFENGRI